MYRRSAFLGLLIALSGCQARHRYLDGSGLEGQLEREVIALKTHVRRLEASCGDTEPDAIYSELVQVIDERDVVMDRQGKVTIVVFPNRLLFNNSGVIREESRKSLDFLAMALSRYPRHHVEVIGHTDDSLLSVTEATRFRSKLDQSYEQASIVAHILVDDYGLDPTRLEISGRGPYTPISTNDTEAGQRTNQRVEVRIRPP